MDAQSDFTQVIGLLYDSVLEESQWNRALEALSAFTGGTGVGHVVADPVRGTITQCATLNVDPVFKDLYQRVKSGKECTRVLTVCGKSDYQNALAKELDEIGNSEPSECYAGGAAKRLVQEHVTGRFNRTLELPAADCSLVTADARRVVEPGDFDLLVGPDSRPGSLLSARFRIG